MPVDPSTNFSVYVRLYGGQGYDDVMLYRKNGVGIFTQSCGAYVDADKPRGSPYNDIYHYVFDTEISVYTRMVGGTSLNASFLLGSGLYVSYSGQSVDKEQTRGSLAQYHTLNGDEDSPGVLTGGFGYSEGWSANRTGPGIYAANDYNSTGALAWDNGSPHTTYLFFILILS